MNGIPAPELELIVVLKWILMLTVASALMTLASLMVKRVWYGSAKYSRRDDDDELNTRGWLERFIGLQKESTAATVLQTKKLDDVLTALRDNTIAMKELPDRWKCNFVSDQVHRRQHER